MHKNLIIWLVTGFLVLQSTAIAAALGSVPDARHIGSVVAGPIVAPKLIDQLNDWQAIYKAAPNSDVFTALAMKKVTQGADYVRQFVKNAEMLDVLARMQEVMASAAGRNELTEHILNRYFLMLGLIQELDLDQTMSEIPGKVLLYFNLLADFYKDKLWISAIDNIVKPELFFPSKIEKTLALTHETIKPAVVFAPAGGIAHADLLQGYFEGETSLHLVGLGIGLSETGVHGRLIRNPAFFILHDLLHYKGRLNAGGFWERSTLQSVYDKLVKGKPRTYTPEDWRHVIGLFWAIHESPQEEKAIMDYIATRTGSETLSDIKRMVWIKMTLGQFVAFGMMREFETLSLFLKPEIAQYLKERTALQEGTKWKLRTLSLQPAQTSVGEPWKEALRAMSSILAGPAATQGAAMRAWFLHMKTSGLLSTIGEVLQGESAADIAETQKQFEQAIDGLTAGEVKEDASFQDLMNFMSTKIGYSRFKSIIDKLIAWSRFIDTDVPRENLHLVRFEYEKKIEEDKYPALEGTMILSFDPKTASDTSTPFKIHRLIQDPFMVPDLYREKVVSPRAEDAEALQAAFAEAVAKLTDYGGVTVSLATERNFHIKDHLYEMGSRYADMKLGPLKGVSFVKAAEAIYKLLGDVSYEWACIV